MIYVTDMIYVTEVSGDPGNDMYYNTHLVITTDAPKAALEKALTDVLGPNAESSDPPSKVRADVASELRRRGITATVDAAEYVFCS